MISKPIKAPFAKNGIEGPAYADRVNGRLTFIDWDRWEAVDQEEFREEFESHCERNRRTMWSDMDAGTFSLSDIS